MARALKNLGYGVVTLDSDPKYKADFQVNILEWDFRSFFKPGHFRIVACSPPCRDFSTALTTRARDLDYGDMLVKRCLEIVEYFQPELWWVENPRFGHLRSRTYMQELPFVDVDYCQFSDWGYKKPTRFWGSPQLGRLDPVCCDPKTCPNVVCAAKNGGEPRYVHRKSLGGNHIVFSRNQKYRIPEGVVEYLVSALDRTSPIPEELLVALVGAQPGRSDSTLDDDFFHFSRLPVLAVGEGDLNFLDESVLAPEARLEILEHLDSESAGHLKKALAWIKRHRKLRRRGGEIREVLGVVETRDPVESPIVEELRKKFWKILVVM